jgi:hypothetical protein
MLIYICVVGISSHDYVLRVVPTIYEKLDGTKLYSFQYTWAYKVTTVWRWAGHFFGITLRLGRQALNYIF